MRIPAALAEEWRHEPDWLDALPRLVADCAEMWSLELEEPVDTPHSLVVPARHVVLKLNAPSHFEADQEPDALQLWDGSGAVRVLVRDDARRLTSWSAACREPGCGTLLSTSRRSWPACSRASRSRSGTRVPSGCWPTRQTGGRKRWSGPTSRRASPSNARSSTSHSRSTGAWAGRRSTSSTRTCTARTSSVRSGSRGLVIDPKPLVGERELDASGLLRNTDDVSLWLDVLGDLGLDRERARGWGVAHNLAWSWDENRRVWSPEHVEDARRILSAR